MKIVPNCSVTTIDLIEMLSIDDVFIELFRPDREFVIEGTPIEGLLPDNLVLETDKLCLRFSWQLKDSVDVEVYGQGRLFWLRLSQAQFNKIKFYLHEIGEYH